jgi:hypothetical protein
VTVHGRPDDPSTAAVLSWLGEQGVPATLADVAAAPLTPEAVWALLELPGNNVRVPFTLIDDAVVLGNDQGRLTAALAEHGYHRPHPGDG